VSTDDKDPSLNAGSSYFVEERAYKAYLAEQANCPQEVSTVCIGFPQWKLISVIEKQLRQSQRSQHGRYKSISWPCRYWGGDS
jgi:hypothetical protein